MEKSKGDHYHYSNNNGEIEKQIIPGQFVDEFENYISERDDQLTKEEVENWLKGKGIG
jgi:hypothetical protein